MQNSQEIRIEELSLLPIVKIILKNKKFILKSICISIIFSSIIILSMPSQYTVKGLLAPESGKNTSSGLSNMASMFGFGNFAVSESDALNVSLFPNIMKSTPFALELYNIPVKIKEKDKDGKIMPFYKYINTQKVPWWKSIIGLPFKLIKSIVSSNQSNEDSDINPFQLTDYEYSNIASIKSVMTAQIDKETNITTISVTLQDPLVAATIADTIVNKLQEYITNYRTQKAIEDYNYQQKIYKKAQEEYLNSQKEYASFVDKNQNINKQLIRIEQERLRDKLNISSQIYQQAATQLEIIKAKIQEDKPVFTILEPASVPLKASSPQKMMILTVCVFFSIAISSSWLIFGKNAWNSFIKYIKS